MPYLIDSDWFIDYIDRTPDALRVVGGFEPEPVYVSAISYMECYEGVLRAPAGSGSAQRIQEWLDGGLVIPFDADIAAHCPEIRALLRRLGRTVNRRSLDLLIAATAVTHGLTVVTRNVEDFRDIPGLTLYEAS